MREDGHCNIVGRIKATVIRGGENVYPARSRSSSTRTPSIEDAQVIGVPDDVPMTVTGKVRKVEMREESVRRFCASARAGRVRFVGSSGVSGPRSPAIHCSRPLLTSSLRRASKSNTCWRKYHRDLGKWPRVQVTVL